MTMPTAPAPDKAFARLGRWVRERPFATALAVLLLVAVPGLVRIENIAIDARKAGEVAERTATRLEDVAEVTATRLEEVAKMTATRLEETTLANAAEACIQRRDTIIALRQLIELIGGPADVIAQELALLPVPDCEEVTP